MNGTSFDDMSSRSGEERTRERFPSKENGSMTMRVEKTAAAQLL